MTGVAMWQRRDRISETEWSTWREVNATEVAELDGKYDYIQFRPLFTQSPRIEDHAAGDYLSTHEGKIRMAFLLARKNAEVRPPDIDDKALWDHELKALDEALASATPSAAMGDGAPVAWMLRQSNGEIYWDDVCLFGTKEAAASFANDLEDEESGETYTSVAVYTTPTKPGHMVVPHALIVGLANNPEDGRFRMGWNACREAMLNATQGGKGEGDV